MSAKPSALTVYSIDRQRSEPLPVSLARTEIDAGRAAVVLDRASDENEECVRLSASVWTARKPEDPSKPWPLRMLDTAHVWALPSPTVAELEALGLVVLPEPDPRRGRPGTKQHQAEGWLLEELAPGPIEIASLREWSKAEGIAWRTLRRAREALDVRTVRRGQPPNQRTWWTLPEL